MTEKKANTKNSIPNRLRRSGSCPQLVVQKAYLTQTVEDHNKHPGIETVPQKIPWFAVFWRENSWGDANNVELSRIQNQGNKRGGGKAQTN